MLSAASRLTHMYVRVLRFVDGSHVCHTSSAEWSSAFLSDTFPFFSFFVLEAKVVSGISIFYLSKMTGFPLSTWPNRFRIFFPFLSLCLAFSVWFVASVNCALKHQGEKSITRITDSMKPRFYRRKQFSLHWSELARAIRQKGINEMDTHLATTSSIFVLSRWKDKNQFE